MWKQQGVALIVSMVILILLGLLGTSVLKESSVQEQMARNFYEKNITFHVSESDVERSFADLQLLTTAMHANGKPVATRFSQTDVLTESEVNYAFTGHQPIAGWSLGSGRGVVSRFQISSETKFASTGTRTRTEHGYYRVNPPSGG